MNPLLSDIGIVAVPDPSQPGKEAQMNGRIMHGVTPAERVAAAFFRLIDRYVVHPPPAKLDYAEIEAAIRQIVDREWIMARIDENWIERTPERKEILEKQMAAIDLEIGKNPLWRILHNT